MPEIHQPGIEFSVVQITIRLMNSPAPDPGTMKPKTRKRVILVSLWTLLGIAGLVLGAGAVVLHRFEKERATWKDATLPGLAGLSISNPSIHQELEALGSNASKGDEGDPKWAGQKILRMANGEYLIYASRHGFNNGRVDHLFLAHGSDGRWYYSTYHFCNRMAAVMDREIPGSIAEFAKTYSAREFDGRSDECLKRTCQP